MKCLDTFVPNQFGSLENSKADCIKWIVICITTIKHDFLSFYESKDAPQGNGFLPCILT